MSASTYFCTELESPWGMNVETSEDGMFHVVIQGSCCIKIESEAEVIHLETGDIIAFPTGGAHWICDEPKSDRLPGLDVVDGILSGNNPFEHSDNNQDSVLLMCGSFSFDSSIDHPFLKELPCFIHLKTSQSSEYAWLNSLVTVMSNESRVTAPGATVVVNRLAEVLFIQLLRAYMQSTPEQMRYMSALMDTQIGRSLNLIHEEETAQWTVKSLGEKVALSRTAFTDKFTQLVGMSPKTYLVNWRMQKAHTLLATSKSTMISIAEVAGYSSEAAFSKAFKQRFDMTPGQVRAAARSLPQT